ncbi:conserved hypothetical protein [Frankia canadensis]|uniref:Uncharacterized protein n=2 Tax=Frankia canadensis TaxID=1836972 RepID=A0A2I2KS87_9ACTN|nr:conserved hypothetical protein [Frankia canadensis]SOU55823.1 conserved hypothetical protein [Frankia canadensis]
MSRVWYLFRAASRGGPGRSHSPTAARRVRAGVSVAIMATMAGGCGNGPTTHADAAPPPSPPVVLDASRLRLPLDPYLLTPRESEWVSQAYRRPLTDCLRRFGLTTPERPVSTGGPATSNERRYGITDPALAASAGYRVAATPSAATPTPPARPTPTGSADPRLLDVLTGRRGTVDGHPVPNGGCSGEARRRMTVGAPAVSDPFLAQRLSQESYGQSGRDRRVQAATHAWSDCMHGHGYDYATPLDAAADPRFRDGPVSRTEITVATTDIACKKQTNLVGVWFAVEAALQKPRVAANRTALENIGRTNEIQLSVAKGLGLG